MSPPRVGTAKAWESGADGARDSPGRRGVHTIARWGPPGLLDIWKPQDTDGSCPL